MKKIYVALIFVIVLLALEGCNLNDNKNELISNVESTTKSEKLNYVDITDVRTNKLITKFYLDGSKVSREKILILVDAYNYKEKTKDKINQNPDYIVHEANVQDSYYDNWYNIYISNNKLYIQDIPEKEKYAEDMKVTSDIYECTKIKPNEFLGVLENSDTSDNAEN